MKKSTLLWIVGGTIAVAALSGGDSDSPPPPPQPTRSGSGSGNYFDRLRSDQVACIAMLIQKMRTRGITNKYMLAAALAVMSKESAFKPQWEVGYGNASNGRIRTIFGERVAHLSDTALTSLKQDDRRFFDLVYKKLGGYKFRGSGLIQLTGKDNYRVYGQRIGVDLLSHPEEANRLGNAAAIAVEYFWKHMADAPESKKREYGFRSINDFGSKEGAIMAAYNATAGWGKSSASLKADPAGGLKLTRSRFPGFLAMAQRS
jgi:predicted chitinase